MPYDNPQFLYLSNSFGRPSEVVNGARLSENISAALLCGRFSNPATDGGCYALGFNPCTTNPTTGGSTAWDETDFSEDGAPWFNGTDASRDAMGFYIEEWTGLGGEHHARSVTGVGNNRGGARFGPQSHNHRVMKLNVLIHGRNAEACNYLYRWLEQTLIAGCDPCSTGQLWFREFDPGFSSDPADLQRGLARMTGVVLIEGPTIEAAPVRDGACFIRRTSFTLAVGDPCIYRVSEFGDNEEFTSTSAPDYGDGAAVVAGPTYWVGTGMQVSVPSPTVDYGQGAAIVDIQSDVEVDGIAGRLSLPDLRIVGYADPLNAGFTRADQAIKIGELTVTGLETSGLEIIVDMAERTIRYRNLRSKSTWRNGSSLLAGATSDVRRWWTWDACAPGFVVVEPKYVGLRNDRVMAQSTNTTARVSAYTVQIDLTSRFGCS